MFIKRKARAQNTYVYRMLVSFKILVTHNFFFTVMTDNCVLCETAFVGHNSFFLSDVVLFKLPRVISSDPIALSLITVFSSVLLQYDELSAGYLFYILNYYSRI